MRPHSDDVVQSGEKKARVWMIVRAIRLTRRGRCCARIQLPGPLRIVLSRCYKRGTPSASGQKIAGAFAPREGLLRHCIVIGSPGFVRTPSRTGAFVSSVHDVIACSWCCSAPSRSAPSRSSLNPIPCSDQPRYSGAFRHDESVTQMLEIELRSRFQFNTSPSAARTCNRRCSPEVRGECRCNQRREPSSVCTECSQLRP